MVNLSYSTITDESLSKLKTVKNLKYMFRSHLCYLNKYVFRGIINWRAMASYQQSPDGTNLGGNCVFELENSRLRLSAGRRREQARFLADPCRLRFEGFATAIGHQTLPGGCACGNPGCREVLDCARWHSRTVANGQFCAGTHRLRRTASPRHAHAVLEDALSRARKMPGESSFTS